MEHADRATIIELIDRLKRGPESVRSSAAEQLARHWLESSDTDALHALTTTAETAGPDAGALAAISALGRLGTRGAVALDALSSALRARNPRLRAEAASSLGRLGLRADRVLERLRRSLEDQDPLVVTRAREALLALGATPPAACSTVDPTGAG